MILEHYAAVLAQLEAGANLSDKVFDTVRRDASGALIRDTYLVLFGGAPDVLDDGRVGLAQLPDADATFVYTVRAVSTTTDGARAIASAGFAQFVGVKVTVSGRTCQRIRHTHSVEVQPDDSIQPPLFWADDEYTLISRRA